MTTLSMSVLSFIIVIVYGLFEWTRIWFCIVCLYMYCRLRSKYQRVRVGIPLTGCISPHFRACSKPGPGFPTSHVVFVLFSVSSVKMRGDCSFLWNSWKWWPSLLKLSFHTHYIHSINHAMWLTTFHLFVLLYTVELFVIRLLHMPSWWVLQYTSVYQMENTALRYCSG